MSRTTKSGTKLSRKRKRKRPASAKSEGRSKFAGASIFVADESTEGESVAAPPQTWTEAKRKQHSETISGYFQLCALDDTVFNMQVLADVVEYIDEYGVPNDVAMEGIRQAVRGDPPFRLDPQQLRDIKRKGKGAAVAAVGEARQKPRSKCKASKPAKDRKRNRQRTKGAK